MKGVEFIGKLNTGRDARGRRGGHHRWGLFEAPGPVARHDLVTAELVAQVDELLGLCLGAEGFVVFAIDPFAPVGAVLLAALLNPHVVLLVCRVCLDTTGPSGPEAARQSTAVRAAHPCRERLANACGPVPPAGGTGPPSHG